MRRLRTWADGVNDTPLSDPWAAFGLLVLGLVLFYLAACIDTGGPSGPGRRALTRLSLLLSGASLVAAVVVAVMS
jgi:hypothetical protein